MPPPPDSPPDMELLLPIAEKWAYGILGLPRAHRPDAKSVNLPDTQSSVSSPGPSSGGIPEHWGTPRFFSATCASAEGVWQPTIAGASWMSSSFSIAATMNSAKSTRRVMLLSRMGSPTCSAPHRQALALAFLEVASAHDRPPRVAGEHPPARLHLVVQVGEPSESREPAEDVHDHLELPRVHVLAVAGDVPPAREHEARPGRRLVEHRLGRPRRIPVDPTGHQHGEHRVTARDRALDDLAVVCCTRDDADAPLEPRRASPRSARRHTPTTSSPGRARAAPCTARASRKLRRCRP